MALYQRGSVYWVSFTDPRGRRVRRSTGTVDRKAAQEYHDTLKAELWRVKELGEKPTYRWQDAVKRWFKEKADKASIRDDRTHLRWLHPYLVDTALKDITRSVIDGLIEKRLEGGVTPATVNRTMEILRAILRRAANEWEWIDKAPKVRTLSEPKRRVRWIEPDEAKRLIAELPEHVAEMARFSLATGLRYTNVRCLEWSQVDMDRGAAWIHADQAKARRPISVPLNESAMAVLKRQRGKHPKRVFTYRGRPLQRSSKPKAWYTAVERAGIVDFRWHDLRHTWASWHIQSGTPLHALQELGGWETAEMVRRYAHLSPSHLAPYADRLPDCDTI